MWQKDFASVYGNPYFQFGAEEFNGFYDTQDLVSSHSGPRLNPHAVTAP